MQPQPRCISPTATRKLGHAHTLPTAPAYSFGNRLSYSPGHNGPGPGEYAVDLNWRRGPGSFGSATRCATPPPQVPCGLDYHTESSAKVVLHSAAQFTLHGGPRPDHKNSNPGPGTYDIDPAEGWVKPGSPAPTMGPRVQPSRTESDGKPGPDAYSPTVPCNIGRSTTLKSRRSPGLEREGSPGPAGYDVRGRISASAGKSFGERATYASAANGVPGPGTYPTPEEVARAQRVAWSLGGRLPDPRANEVPGPGTYGGDPYARGANNGPSGRSSRSENVSSPSYSFGGRPGATPEPETPSGGDYRPQDWVRSRSPAFTFHGTTPKDAKAWMPGPGTYEVPADGPTYRHSPAITPGARFDDPGNFEKRPGPQAYYLPKAHSTKPAVTLKSRHPVIRASWDFGGPGPAEYTVARNGGQQSASGPRQGYSFGQRPPADTREDVPGPVYKIGCSTLGVAGAPRMEIGVMERSLVL